MPIVFELNINDLIKNSKQTLDDTCSSLGLELFRLYDEVAANAFHGFVYDFLSSTCSDFEWKYYTSSICILGVAWLGLQSVWPG